MTDLDTWLVADIEAEDFTPQLDDYGGVYIGNGDPAALLQRLHESGLFTALQEACTRGCVLYGTSAGSMMFGANARVAASPVINGPEQPPEEVNGLNVIQAEDGTDLVVVPHWRSGRTNVWEAVAESTGLRVALIADGNAWTVNSGEYAAIGPDGVEWVG